MRKGDWIQTYLGTVFYPLDPRQEEIDISDIAHALSNLCRFGGHCNQFYSVAEHSVRVALILPQEQRLWGLLHDASEAYLCDLPRPIKRFAEFGPLYREVEDNLQKIIFEKYGLIGKVPDSVKKADTDLLMTEKRDLMHGCNKAWEDIGVPLIGTIVPQTTREAEEWFLNTFIKLRS